MCKPGYSRNSEFKCISNKPQKAPKTVKRKNTPEIVETNMIECKSMVVDKTYLMSVQYDMEKNERSRMFHYYVVTFAGNSGISNSTWIFKDVYVQSNMDLRNPFDKTKILAKRVEIKHLPLMHPNISLFKLKKKIMRI